MLSKLKKEVLKANQQIDTYDLVKFTWGTASAIDDERKYVVIKPSGVPYKELKTDDLVVVDLDENIVEGDLRPSVDTRIHLELYKAYQDIRGIVHTHSPYACAFAQANKAIPCLGTTHSDYFHGEIPITRELTKEEVQEAYELNTGKAIVEAFKGQNVNHCPGVLQPNHGPFVWGKNVEKAIYHAVVLEEVARIAYYSLALNPSAEIPEYLMEEHFERKHGKNARYGQIKSKG
jgi:L-ribulose-5-phosphate 4-epimerase